MYINIHSRCRSTFQHCQFAPIVSGVSAWAGQSNKYQTHQTRFRWSYIGPASGWTTFNFSFESSYVCTFNKFKSQQHAPASENLHLADVSFPFLCAERKPLNACLCVNFLTESNWLYIYMWLTGLHEDILYIPHAGGDTAVLTPPWLIFKPLMYSF